MKTKFNELRNSLMQLSKEELAVLFADVFSSDISDDEHIVIPDCPHCSSSKVIRFGMKNGKQRYYCKECSKTFLPTTNTVMFMSHFDKTIWQEMLQDTLDGQALAYSEKRLGISHQVAFNMRHKLLLAFQDVRENDPVVLSDVSELDETFVLDCYKGKKLPSEVNRKSRKHGAKAVKRGISNEYVCICTGVQRKGNVIVESVNRAKPTSEELAQIFSGHIGNGTLAITDGLRSYNVLETIANCTVVDINHEEGRGMFNLNTANSLHSYIKATYNHYRGVATKYLNRYNALFSIAFRFTKDMKNNLFSSLCTVGNNCYWHSVGDVRTYQLVNL